MQTHTALAKLRKDAGLSQAEAAAYPTGRGCPVTHRAVSKWERCDAQPDMDQFLIPLELYRVPGDSVPPRFRDGDVVYIEKRPPPEKGEIGIFVLNGEAYLKKPGNQGRTELVSFNPAYAPIPVGEEDAPGVVGRVLG